MTQDKIANQAVGRNQLAGQSVAANNMRPGSVWGGLGGTITDESITDDDLADNSVGGDEIQDGSVLSRDIDNIQVSQIRGLKAVRRSNTQTITRAYGDAVAHCENDEFLLSGGYDITNETDWDDSPSVVQNGPVGDLQGYASSWIVRVDMAGIQGDLDNDDSITLTAYAYCLDTLPDNDAP